jgi:hypothetical protein
MMTNQELTALKAVLDYLAEEEDDCKVFVEMGGNPDNHIYTHVQTLKDYVRGLYSTGNIKENNDD